MSDQQIDLSAKISADGFDTAERKMKSLSDTVKDLQSAIVSLLSTSDALGQSLANVANVDFKKINKGMKSARTAEDQFLSRTAAQAGSMNRAGIKTASNHTELQEHIKAMADLANSNAKLVEVMKHLTPEEIGLKKSGQKIATANTQLGWAKLENQQDRFFKYSNNFMGGLASNLQIMNSRIMNGGGLMGFMGRLGYRMSHNKNGFFSAAEYKGIDKATGKPIYGDLPKNNINRWLGLDKVTGGKGINFGPMAMLAPVAAVAGVAALGKAIYNLGEEAKVATGQIQAIKTQMSIVMGGDAVAENIYSGVEKFALKSPFGVATSADMAALLKQSGVNASDLLQTLRMIGDTSSGNAEKMKRVANNYAQIQAIGKASMLDMRQFAYAGIPIYKEVADYIKVSQQELRRMISDGKVTANIIEDVFKRMTSAGGIFENATLRGSQTIAAREQNLADAQLIAKAQFGEAYMNGMGRGYGSGFGNWVLNTKENVAKAISEHYAGVNAVHNAQSALSALEEIKKHTESLDKKIKEEDYSSFIDEYALKDIIKASGGKDKIYSDISRYVKSDKGYGLGKSFYSEAEAKYYESIIKKHPVTANVNKIASAFTAPFQYLSPSLTPVIKAAYQGILGGFGNKATLEAMEMKKNYITKEEWERNYNTVKNSDNKDLFFSFAYGEVKEMLQNNNDMLEKMKKLPVSEAKYFNGESLIKPIQDLSSQFKTEWKSSWLGKIDEQKKKNDEWNLYSKTYNEFSKYQDKNNNLLTKNISTLTELEKIFKSGLFTPEKSIDFTNMTNEQSVELGKRLAKAKEFVINETLSKNSLNKEYVSKVKATNGNIIPEVKALELIQRINNNVKDIDLRNKMITNAFVDFKYSTFHSLGEDNFKYIMSFLENTFKMDTKAQRYSPPELWKRIFGGMSGFNPERMVWGESFAGKTYGTFQGQKDKSGNLVLTSDISDWLRYHYDTYGKRDLSENLMLGLLGDRKTKGKERGGFTLAEMTAALVTEQDKTLNWEKTQKNLEKLAFSANATASSLSSYASAIDAQTNKYKQLYTKLYTQGESLEQITLAGSLNKELESAIENEGVYTKDNKRVTFNADTKKFMAGDKELSQTELVDVGNKLVDVLKRLIDQNDKTANIAESTSEWIKKLENMKFVANGATSFLRGANPLSGQDIIAHSRLSRISWTEDDYNDFSKRAGFANALKQRVFSEDGSSFKSGLGIVDKGLKNEMEKLGIVSDRELTDEQVAGITRYINKIADAQSAMEKLGEATKNALMGGIGDGINNTMAKLGENIAKGVEGYEDMDKVLKQVGKSMMGNLAAAATQAGLSLISSGNYAAGFALIAAGGLGSFLSGLMTDSKDDEKDDITQKLKDLKQDLADLLKQAREDAIYYENHLRHTNALSYNSQLSNTTKVNDAIITPQGNVITTHPEDYLIASKNPSGLVSGNAAPVVNIDIQNNSGSKLNVKQQRSDNSSGGVDIVAVIEQVAGDYIASSRGDEAFAARDARINGRSVVA